VTVTTIDANLIFSTASLEATDCIVLHWHDIALLTHPNKKLSQSAFKKVSVKANPREVRPNEFQRLIAGAEQDYSSRPGPTEALTQACRPNRVYQADFGLPMDDWRNGRADEAWHPNAPVWVGFTEGKPFGYFSLTVEPEYGDKVVGLDITFDMIYVLPGLRGLGFGKALAKARAIVCHKMVHNFAVENAEDGKATGVELHSRHISMGGDLTTQYTAAELKKRMRSLDWQMRKAGLPPLRPLQLDEIY
jgi:GNAT superfamily N-acetyltransferase